MVEVSGCVGIRFQNGNEYSGLVVGVLRSKIGS